MKLNVRNIIIESSRPLLLLMWVYTVLSKLLNPTETKAQMTNQLFPLWMANSLFYIIPILEGSIILLLLFKSTRIAGYWGSALLLLVFTAYISLVKLSYFGRIPCSCGGIISGLSWTQHLLFNILFLTLSLLGLSFTIKERRINGKAT